MAYQALYRQWRSRRFDELIGQDVITTTLKRQVQTGRIAHAYLFSGTRGTGKTSTAQILSRAINCLTPEDGEPCGHCANCLSLAQGTSLDVEEIDAASNNGVDEIRSLRDKIKYPPQNAKYRVYIIDEVHMLSTGAFNALLKTLEEPPAHAVLILATTEPQRLPATILSRCQRFDFKRIPAAEIAGRLREAVEGIEGAQAQDEALMAIARAAEGGMRDGFSILDMCLSSSPSVTVDSVEEALGTAGRSFLFTFGEALGSGDLAQTLTLIDRAMRDGRDAAVLARDIAAHLRSLLVCGTAADAAADILEISPDELARYAAQAKALGVERTLRALELYSRADPEMRWAAHPRTILELATAKACRPEGEADLSALLARVETLEQAVKNGIAAAPARPSAGEKAGASPVAAPASPRPAAPRAEPPKADAAFWQEVLKQIKTGHIAQYTALRRARLLAREQDVVHIAYEPQDDVFYKMMSIEANLAILNEALSGVAGKPIQARLRIAGQDAAPAPAAAQDWVQEAVELFGRDKVELREKE